jgi:ribosomal protein S18 acetylase RimI-like enzyme
MQRLVQEAWAVVGLRNQWHVGDLAWSATQHTGREHEWRRRLWEEDGRVVAYAWLIRPRTLDWQIDPRRPELLDDVIDWFEAEADEGPPETTARADDAGVVEALTRRGYQEVTGEPWLAVLARDLDALPEPDPPAGYRLRTMRGDDDVERRVEVHRAAFEPSRVTVESYRNVMRTWPYRADLDCIAESADGTFAAYALAWLDDENRVGELEPVGTHPDHRRRGLGRAVNLLALHRLRHAGAELAIVLCRGDEAYPVPKRLYEAVGFRRHSRIVGFRKARP